MTQFAEQQFALDLAEPGQSSKRTHLESVERQTGKRPLELDGQECPYELEYLMYWWSEIHDGSLEGLTFTEISRWAELAGITLQWWELKGLMTIDIAFRKQINALKEKAHARTNKPSTPSKRR